MFLSNRVFLQGTLEIPWKFRGLGVHPTLAGPRRVDFYCALGSVHVVLLAVGSSRVFATDILVSVAAGAEDN